MITELFYLASRNCIRFSTPKGELTTEQLWGFPLTSLKGVSLDTIAKDAYRALKNADEESFVGTSQNTQTAILQLKLDLVKEIIQIRQEEESKQTGAVLKKQLKQQLTDILVQKQQNSLLELSEEEIQKKLKKLNE